jgi:sec-independent protein translocase protein TatC
MAKNDAQAQGGPELPFVSHLLELRDRLLRIILAIAVVFVALFPFANPIYTEVAKPLMQHLPAGTTMIATQVASPFLTPFKLTLVAAVFLAMPFILYQLWAFVAPGLYQHERKLVMPLVFSSALLFYVGVAFAYYVVFPLVFAFLTGTAPEGVSVMTDISAYLDFVLTLFFAFGLAFEVPIATILLVWMGVTTPESMVQKRPYVIVGAFLIGMFLTPPDVISQTLLALPMWVLFELGVIFSRFFVRRRGAEGQEAAQAAGVAGSGAAGSGPAEPPPPSGGGSGFHPLSEQEMDDELDRIEREDAGDAAAGDAAAEDEGDAVAAAKLLRVKELRDRGENDLARALLNEVVEEGDEVQVAVARNILQEMDDGF